MQQWEIKVFILEMYSFPNKVGHWKDHLCACWLQDYFLFFWGGYITGIQLLLPHYVILYRTLIFNCDTTSDSVKASGLNAAHIYKHTNVPLY